MIKTIPIKLGQKYTIYSLSGIASTLRKEVVVKHVNWGPIFRPQYQNQVESLAGTWRLGTYKEYRGRKEYHLSICPERDLIIPGWGHLKTDAEEHHSFTGNACLNIAGTVEQVKEIIDKNINENFTAFDTIIAWPKSHTEMPDGEGLLVYPDTDSNHAVIQKMKEKQNA